MKVHVIEESPIGWRLRGQIDGTESVPIFINAVRTPIIGSVNLSLILGKDFTDDVLPPFYEQGTKLSIPATLRKLGWMPKQPPRSRK